MIHELLHIGIGIIERGIIFGVVVAGVYLSSRLINFDNLSVEGAFGLGGAVTALLLSWHINPWLALFAAACAGTLSGVLTGILHTQLRLNALISGIVITTGLFSITLKIAGSAMVLPSNKTLFTSIEAFASPYQQLIMLILLACLLLAIISWFLHTEIGFLLKAVGDTPQMLTNIGQRSESYITLGLALSNMLASLSGSLFVQYVGYFSIWANVGILIIGLAGMLIAQTISNRFGLVLFIGAIAYQALVALTFELQLDQDWNKLVTAMLIVLLIIIKQYTKTRSTYYA